ncbi:MAG TPA: nucleoside-diphosphate sugar epimerase/dehydratase [Vulgatibacter sp.]|nr:nucleoside-diphosphate sugar epimerase/dehydratase [Vulgatibacter sp.]
MQKFIARASQATIDVALLAGALGLAFLLRFDWRIPPQMVERLAVSIPWVVSVQYGLLTLFGARRFSWRFIGLHEAIRIAAALATVVAALLALRFVVPELQNDVPLVGHFLLPIGVIALDGMLAFFGLAGVRAGRRLLGERANRLAVQRGADSQVPTMLIGAGMAGGLVAREIARRPDLGIRPIGFLDDDKVKQGEEVHGIKVLGPTDRVAELCTSYGAKQVLITIASAPRKEIRRIALQCEESGIPTKIIPGLFEIVGGQVNLSRIRSVEIEDLLGREPVQLDTEAIAEDLKDSVVLVTGAGGSIGSELCRQIARFRPKTLLLVEQAENALFNIHRELAASYPRLPLNPLIADVCDAARMKALFDAHRPQVVFHAAAHKHVPMMEWNPGEAVKNNVVGTRTVADLSHAFGVRQFVMISTDKAVNPTSVMGATKRVAEIYVQGLSGHSRTRFVTVRFGNVLGSAGSVIPIFQEQIAKGGPVTVTDPEMRRYFMTIPEACQLVLQAGSMGEGGEIFVLDMGEPVKIVDLARDLITLSGLKPGEDIEIEFTGIRPGEKLFEELSVAEEEATKTKHPKVYVGRVRPIEWSRVPPALEALLRVADEGSPEAIRAHLRALVPEYEPVLLEDGRRASA